MTSATTISYIFEEWIGTTYPMEYFLLGLMWLFLASIAGVLWVLFYVYLSAFVVLIYEKTLRLKGKYDVICYLILAYLWDIFGRIWHGYELHGIENIPNGPGLVIYYHAAIPLDYMLFIARYFLLKKKICHSVVDRFVFKLPGLKNMLEILQMKPGTKDECLCTLKEGHLMAISPGGMREALFSDENYKMIWGKRKGFAQIALDAKVPIIPVFTQNAREGYRTSGKIGALRKLYESFRMPVLLIYGGWPVKWRTYIGEPIPYDPDITVEDLAKKAKFALQHLIDKHQRKPGCILRALLERFYNPNHAKDV
uniref:Phospholipid/glycerol acyltransferase domain-containing protein n=2 Tax=Anolis carolinensis TaxID=28377 RepID=A0A803TH50_ANOCA|nr:PREDICTED: transmembrane protein 68 isoform X1 [Anolis carolinensis]XP_016851149.1 PREDICTED: transmembrane protein 68 isoform X1 [Anolis carolinensis]|eukprot:XP_008114417.1 PREDICTED: transmembrane protein 68 isoform X1 [Anolis carolinensis]